MDEAKEDIDEECLKELEVLGDSDECCYLIPVLKDSVKCGGKIVSESTYKKRGTDVIMKDYKYEILL